MFESSLGEKINIPDETYIRAGAKISSSEDIFLKSDIVFNFNQFYAGQSVKQNTSLVGIHNFLFFKNRLDSYLEKPISVYSLDLLPRTTLAQKMDVLSSMASLAGYKAVIKAAELYSGGIPMFTTAAGLQAIATAKRLGAVVAFDVRSSAGEEIRSLGAKFIEVPGFREAENSGGYTVVQTNEYLEKQKELINQHIEEASIVICTANIPSKKVVVMKGSMNAGYSGATNKLFEIENCTLLFGDAKDTLQKIINDLKLI